MQEDHAKIQKQIHDFDKNSLNDSSDFSRNQHFVEGRYKVEYHKKIISYLQENKGMTILDVGCFYAQIGLEILGLDPSARYIGIEKSDKTIKIARKRLESCSWCEGRYELIFGDVFTVFSAQSIRADIVLLTWSPMIDMKSFNINCLPKVDGWQKWILEYIPMNRAIIRKLMFRPIKSIYNSYSKRQVETVTKQYSSVDILYKPKLSQLSKIISINR